MKPQVPPHTSYRRIVRELCLLRRIELDDKTYCMLKPKVRGLVYLHFSELAGRNIKFESVNARCISTSGLIVNKGKVPLGD